MKAYVIVMLVLILASLALGVYAANNSYGYIALLMGIIAGKLSTSFFTQLKVNNNNNQLKKEAN